MYIQKADYKTRIDSDLLNQMLNDSDSSEADILEQCSSIAEGCISTRAGVLYDIAPELVKVGTARNFMLFSYALSIAVYELYQRIDDEQIPEKVVKNYNDAMNDLEKTATGKGPLNLPRKPADDGGTEGSGETPGTQGQGLRRIGYAPKRSHRI